MTRPLVVLLALVFPLTALAERTLELKTTSLQTGQNGIARVPVNTPVVFTALFSWTAPGEAGVVELDVPVAIDHVLGGQDVICTGEHPVRCEARPDRGPIHSFVQVSTKLTSPGVVTATARLDTLVRTVDVEVVDKPSLSTQASYGNYRIEPGGSWRFGGEVVNHGATATNVVLTATLTNGGRITEAHDISVPRATCTFTDTVITCKAASLAYNQYIGVDANFVAPETRDGGKVHFDVQVKADQEDFDPSDDTAVYDVVLVRHIAVTNANDDGAGSFRQALLDAAVLCALDPCTIEFPDDPRTVIKLRSPLPDVRGVIKIDGRGQAELDGSALKEGAGLSLRDGCEIVVQSMHIHDFPGAGIDVRRGTQKNPCGAHVVTRFPATELLSNRFEANERGIVISSTDYIDIINNSARENRRSGLFADATYWLSMYDNEFSHNGASGMFLNAGSGGPYPGGAELLRNSIRENGEWGIALTKRGDVTILNNEISGNRYPGIDIDLDFETPNVPDDTITTPNKPVLVSAIYDPVTNTTTVRGTLNTHDIDASRFTVQIFSSPRPGEGESFVGEQKWTEVPPSEFAITVNGDLRGRYVTATHTRSHFLGLSGREVPTSIFDLAPADTSEFSNALKVE